MPTVPLFMDTHYRVDDLSANRIMEAHRRDEAAAARHGVHWINYWFDEGSGKLYCLCEAPTAEAAESCHREAHGLIADEISEVREYGGDLADRSRGPLCMDTHFRIEGLTPQQIADAIQFHEKAGAKYGVHWLKAWYDDRSGRLFCLSESPTTEAHIAVHGEAGLLVDEVTTVTEGLRAT